MDENSVNFIDNNSVNTFRAIAEAKRKKELGFFDNDELEIVIRKFKVFEKSSYLDDIYELVRVFLIKMIYHSTIT